MTRLVVFLCAVGVLAATAAHGREVEMFHSTASRLGQSSYPIPRVVPRIRWSFATKRSIVAQPIRSRDGTLFVASLDGCVYALRTEAHVANRLIWKRCFSGPVYCTPALVEGRIIVGADDRAVHAMDAKTGANVWQFRLSACPQLPGFGYDRTRCDADSSVAVGPSGDIYFGGDAVYKLSARGVTRFRHVLVAHAFSSPAVSAQGTVVIGTHDNTVVALTGSGRLAWTFRGSRHFDATPALSRGHAIVGSDDGRVRALDMTTGRMVWEVATRGPIRASPAIGSDGVIRIGSYDRRMYAITSEGEVTWMHVTGGRIHGSVVVDSSGAMIFGSQDNALYALDKNGYRLWRLDLESDIDSTPVVAPDGWIYVGSDSGRLYALQ